MTINTKKLTTLLLLSNAFLFLIAVAALILGALALRRESFVQLRGASPSPSLRYLEITAWGTAGLWYNQFTDQQGAGGPFNEFISPSTKPVVYTYYPISKKKLPNSEILVGPHAWRWKGSTGPGGAGGAHDGPAVKTWKCSNGCDTVLLWLNNFMPTPPSSPEPKKLPIIKTGAWAFFVLSSGRSYPLVAKGCNGLGCLKSQAVAFCLSTQNNLPPIGTGIGTQWFIVCPFEPDPGPYPYMCWNSIYPDYAMADGTKAGVARESSTAGGFAGTGPISINVVHSPTISPPPTNVNCDPGLPPMTRSCSPSVCSPCCKHGLGRKANAGLPWLCDQCVKDVC